MLVNSVEQSVEHTPIIPEMGSDTLSKEILMYIPIVPSHGEREGRIDKTIRELDVAPRDGQICNLLGWHQVNSEVKMECPLFLPEISLQRNIWCLEFRSQAAGQLDLHSKETLLCRARTSRSSKTVYI
jgi:hypothetical protein